MLHTHDMKVLRASPFFVLLAVSVGSIFYFSSAEFLKSIPRWLLKHIPIYAAYRIESGVSCSSRAYELEAVRLTVHVNYPDGVMRPVRFRIEAPSQIEVQGDTELEIIESGSWFLLPKEQGEYVVVVRGLGEARSFEYDQHISVYRIDHLSRRWFVILTTVGSVIAFIGLCKALVSRKQASPREVAD
jgi:hypothetical protein